MAKQYTSYKETYAVDIPDVPNPPEELIEECRKDKEDGEGILGDWLEENGYKRSWAPVFLADFEKVWKEFERRLIRDMTRRLYIQSQDDELGFNGSSLSRTYHHLYSPYQSVVPKQSSLTYLGSS